MSSRQIYASQMGMVYRLTVRQWRRFLDARARGDADLGDYGTELGRVLNVTDWSAGDAADEAARINYGGTP